MHFITNVNSNLFRILMSSHILKKTKTKNKANYFPKQRKPGASSKSLLFGLIEYKKYSMHLCNPN